jgi:energy-coupling factor transporter ATP-binding protein EcfA2
MSSDQADRFPDELSGGQRQRIAIARAVVGERGLLLADEPTGALDSVNGEAVMRLLRAATQRGVAGVVVTHEAQLASWADRVVFLRDGHVVDQTCRSSWPGVAPCDCRSVMTTLAHRSELAGSPRSSAVTARRALVRWSGRMLRREWRQQLLVLTLLSVSVAAAIGSITVVYNAVPADDGEFGSANYLLNFDGSNPRKLNAALESARMSFGTIDVIGHRSVRVPGPSRPSTTAHKILPAPTVVSCSRSAAVATPRAAIRSPSPMELRSRCSSPSGPPWQSTGTGEPSWASSRIRAS